MMIRRISCLVAPLGVSALLVLAGCGHTTPPPTASSPDVDQHEATGHPDEGPHHGHLIELGQEEYHAELTHDEATKTVTVYLLDSEAKVAVPIADGEIALNLVVGGKPLQVKLAAAPQEEDPQGQASRFSIVDEAVLEALEAPETSGKLNVTIGGKPYTGGVDHHEHDEHED